MKGRVIFNEDTCKGCGLCVNACPMKILALDLTRVNKIGYTPAHCFDMDKCIACTNCALMCPDSCITVERLDV
ncbi:MAG: 2-oxoglutarate ferredoxin oxidoreductase subunit delta [Erysipelotrichaceae bacterium]|nr:MAG: 2-oxoglutarate ferredoxin oxidoreductase subunit [Erysipelotrichaceae bacterium]TXT18181.1 MAG: 2-oxoglutarate ferredoxin oxidoreductase subunit delta [Erysipelotrichaceae bacterium]